MNPSPSCPKCGKGRLDVYTTRTNNHYRRRVQYVRCTNPKCGYTDKRVVMLPIQESRVYL